MAGYHLLMTGINQLPGFLYLLLEGDNGCLVLFTEPERSLNLCRVAHNFSIELSHLLCEALLIVCRQQQQQGINNTDQCAVMFVAVII